VHNELHDLDDLIDSLFKVTGEYLKADFLAFMNLPITEALYFLTAFINFKLTEKKAKKMQSFGLSEDDFE
jgi:hypothetical protein